MHAVLCLWYWQLSKSALRLFHITHTRRLHCTCYYLIVTSNLFPFCIESCFFPFILKSSIGIQMNKQSKFLILPTNDVFQLWVYSSFQLFFSFNNYFLLCFFILISIKIKVFFTILFKKYLKKSMQEYMTSKDCVKKVPFKALLSVFGAPPV